MLAPTLSERDFAEEKLPPLPYESVPPYSVDVKDVYTTGHKNHHIINLPQPIYRQSISTVSSYASLKSAGNTPSVFSHTVSRRSSTSTIGSLPQDAPPTLTKTPWEHGRGRKLPYGAVRPGTARSIRAPIYQLSPKYFIKFTPEVYEAVVRQLELSYFGKGEGGCINCYLNDLYNIGLVSRNWLIAVTMRLYGRLWLPMDEWSETKKFRGDSHRLKLLRRTLRERSPLARLVHEIRIPGLQYVYAKATSQERGDMVNQAAALVMSCPNLEKFDGLTLSYDHEYDRLTHALSTRTKLRERLWSFKAAQIVQDEFGQSIMLQKKLSGYGVDLPDAFLNTHTNWNYLRTLILSGQGNGSMDYRSFAATFRSLPILSKLAITDFCAFEFDDRTLAALPQTLDALRLQNLPGVTEKGLRRFVGSQTATRLRSLHLIHLEISCATIIRAVFLLPYLDQFTLVQQTSPVVFNDEHVPHPFYSAARLKYLHWEIYNASPATTMLAESIMAGVFPQLTRVRVPYDHEGLFQSMCKPTGNVVEAEDLLNDPSLLDLIALREKSVSFGPVAKSRWMAQYRIEKTRQNPPRMRIVVENNGVITERINIRDFLGRIESNIEYCLEPDASSGREFLARLSDLLEHGMVRSGGAGNASTCSGPGWGDVKPGQEGRKGRTHEPRKLYRFNYLDVFF